MRISFLIPAYNERETIRQVLSAVDALDLDRQLIVIDDGSTDGTADEVEEWRKDKRDVILLRQTRNLGKGSAIRAGIGHVDGDIVVIQDADLVVQPTCRR